MAIKLAILKSGENIISDIHEMVIGENVENNDKEKVVGYIFTKPCIVTLTSNLTDLEKKTVEIKMSPWIPLTKSNQVPVALDWVVTLVDPVDKLKNMYEEDVLNGKRTNQNNSIE
jgi:hypothetical protein